MTDTEYWNKMVDERNAFKKHNEALLKLLEVYRSKEHQCGLVIDCLICNAEEEYERTINGK